MEKSFDVCCSVRVEFITDFMAGGAMSGSVISACSEMYVIIERCAPMYKGCTRVLCTSPYAQGQIKVEDYIELLVFITVNIFLIISSVRFFLVEQ